MKIIFICTALEAGRDGVGDYTRRLAGECSNRGHDCTIIALNDPHVSRVTDQTPENVRFIRLPSAQPWIERLDCAGNHLQRISPDWISWQIVAYGFHPRGFLPGILLRHAAALRGPRCHVMLHELWIGLEIGASWKARATGWLQRRGVLCLLDQLNPDCVQTSCAAYQHALAHEGWKAGVLGLFGNIPIEPDLPEIKTDLGRWLPVPAGSNGAAPLVAITFGTLHPQWQPGATAEWLRATALRQRRSPVLIAIGRTGPHADPILNLFRQHGVQVVLTADLETANISHLLGAADLGFAPHPWALIGKSGAAAAMLEHGLPVLVPRDDWRLRGSSPLPPLDSDPLLTRLIGLEAAHADRWLAARRAPKALLPEIAGAFLKTLERTKPVPSS